MNERESNKIEDFSNLVSGVRCAISGWKILLGLIIFLFIAIMFMVLTLPFSNADSISRVNENEKNLAYISTAELFGYDWQLLIAKDITVYENNISKADPLQSMLDLTNTIEYIKTTVKTKDKNGRSHTVTTVKEYKFNGSGIRPALEKILGRTVANTAEDISKGLKECPSEYIVISKSESTVVSRKVVTTYLNTPEMVIEKYFPKDKDKIGRFTMTYESGILEDYIKPYTEYGVDLSPDLLRKVTGFFNAPVDNYHMTSPFGKRVDPFTGAIANHLGADLVSQDRRIYASAKGIVVFAGPKGSYGNYVKVKHQLDDGTIFHSAYGHLARIAVSVGQEVTQTTVIGQMGTTGNSTGIHLHFEIIDPSGNHINPMPFIESGKIE